MTFEFFNPTDLAFGQKLTAVFTSLDNLSKAAEANIKEVIENTAYYYQYYNKNYRVRRPSKADDPCRVDELFDLLNDKTVYIKNFNLDSNKLYVDIVSFNRNNNRITHATGSTELKKGYCYFKESVSNKSVNTELTFTNTLEYGKGSLLFKFRIDKNGNINFIGDISLLGIKPHDMGGYSQITLEKQEVAGDNTEYTAEDYECLCIVGKSTKLRVHRNDKYIFGGVEGSGYISEQRGERHCILYVKPNDVITGVYSKIYRVIYS